MHTLAAAEQMLSYRFIGRRWGFEEIWFCIVFRLKKYRAAHSEMLFPDEIETPMDVAARLRFQK